MTDPSCLLIFGYGSDFSRGSDPYSGSGFSSRVGSIFRNRFSSRVRSMFRVRLFSRVGSIFRIRFILKGRIRNMDPVFLKVRIKTDLKACQVHVKVHRVFKNLYRFLYEPCIREWIIKSFLPDFRIKEKNSPDHALIVNLLLERFFSLIILMCCTLTEFIELFIQIRPKHCQPTWLWLRLWLS